MNSQDNMINHTGTKKTLRILGTVASWVLVAVAMLTIMTTAFSLSYTDQARNSFFGLRGFVVQSDSMSQANDVATEAERQQAVTFNAGDIVVSYEVPLEELKEGDIITFVTRAKGHVGEFVTHKIRGFAVEDGKDVIITYGTSSNRNDSTKVIKSKTYVVGKYAFHIPKVGYFVNFLRDNRTIAFILCIFLPFLLVLVVHGLRAVFSFLAWKRMELDKIRRARESLLALAPRVAELENVYGAEARPVLDDVSEMILLVAKEMADESEESAPEAEAAEPEAAEPEAAPEAEATEAEPPADAE